MSSSLPCGCCVCPTHEVAGSGPRPGGPAEWAGPAWEHWETMVAWLDGPEAMTTGHGDLETRLSVEGREQQRLLMQGHLEERAARETRRTGVTGNDGVARRRVEKDHQRPLTSVFGSVTVTRKAYRAAPGPPAAGSTPDATTGDATPDPTVDPRVDAVVGEAKGGLNLYPADAVLNLPVGKHSAGLARLVAVEAARGSFDEVVAAIERATGVGLGKRQVEGLARAAAVDVDAFYTARRPTECGPDRVLGLQADGKGVVMRPDGLREATARAAAKAGKGKLATRLSPGEKHGRKRMAEVVAVYDVDPVPRSINDIIPGSRRRRCPGRKQGPVATGKWLNASVTDDIPAVIKAMFDEAERRDPTHARTWVALVDGNRQQIDAIAAEAAARHVTVIIIVDFVHGYGSPGYFPAGPSTSPPRAATGSPRRSWPTWGYWPTWGTSACTPRRSSGTGANADRRPSLPVRRPPTSRWPVSPRSGNAATVNSNAGRFSPVITGAARHRSP